MKKVIGNARSRLTASTSSSTGSSFEAIPEIASQSAYSLPVVRGPVSAKNLTAIIVAESIVAFCERHGDVVTNLRLQKLLYYTQAWHLALYGESLFPEKFEAWSSGPVQPDTYARFKHFGSQPITILHEREWKLPQKVDKHIADVMQSYGRLSPYELELLVCQETPWHEARGGLPADAPCNRQISIATMRRYYKSRLHGKEKEQPA